MSSGLRFSRSPSSPQPTSITRTTVLAPPQKKQKMSLTQTYYLAHTARGKLSKEASRADHDLRLLVGHANLLDGLMLDLADAEREQESWFNQTVKGATTASEERRRVQWADTIPEEAVDEEEEDEEEDDDDVIQESWENGSSDDESESDEEEIRVAPTVPLRRQSRPEVTVRPVALEEDMEVDDDDDDDLTLTRTSSHPPELLHESDSESDDDAMPPSPPQPERLLDGFSHKQRQAIVTTSFYHTASDPSSTATAAAAAAASLPPSEQASFFDEGFYLPQRSPPTALVSAF